MTNFTIEQLEALKEGTTPGPWVITPHQNPVGIQATRWHGIPMEIANADLAEAAPALVDALIAEKRNHGDLRQEIGSLIGRLETRADNADINRSYTSAVAFRETAQALNRILEATDE